MKGVIRLEDGLRKKERVDYARRPFGRRPTVYVQEQLDPHTAAFSGMMNDLARGVWLPAATLKRQDALHGNKKVLTGTPASPSQKKKHLSRSF